MKFEKFEVQVQKIPGSWTLNSSFESHARATERYDAVCESASREPAGHKPNVRLVLVLDEERNF